MKVFMKEHYQDANVHLYPDKEYEVDSVLGEWLVKHHKAVQVEITYRHLDVTPQFEQAEEPPKPQEFKNRKAGRRQS